MKKATTTLFAQLVGMMPRSILEGIAAQFYKPGNASKFTVWDQLVALVFCHIGGCDSLREIEDGLYSALSLDISSHPFRDEKAPLEQGLSSFLGS